MKTTAEAASHFSIHPVPLIEPRSNSANQNWLFVVKGIHSCEQTSIADPPTHYIPPEVPSSPVENNANKKKEIKETRK